MAVNLNQAAEAVKKEGIGVVIPDLPATLEEIADKTKSMTYTDDFAPMMHIASFEQMQRIAKIYAMSGLIPDSLTKDRSKEEAIAAVFVALQIARRLKADPFMVMQAIYVVHGRPGFEAKFVIAMCNTRGPWVGGIRFEMDDPKNPTWCRAYAKRRDTGEVDEYTLTWGDVVKEGWNKPRGGMDSKWNTLRALMFMYRSATFLSRTKCPEVMLGLHTTDELEDITINDIVEATISKQTIESKLKATQAKADAMAEPPHDPVTGEVVAETVAPPPAQAPLLTPSPAPRGRPKKEAPADKGIHTTDATQAALKAELLTIGSRAMHAGMKADLFDAAKIEAGVTLDDLGQPRGLTPAIVQKLGLIVTDWTQGEWPASMREPGED
jgi:hypothetical protein